MPWRETPGRNPFAFTVGMLHLLFAPTLKQESVWPKRDNRWRYTKGERSLHCKSKKEEWPPWYAFAIGIPLYIYFAKLFEVF